MNRQEADILYSLLGESCPNQRRLAEICGYSLGTVNRAVRALTEGGYLDERLRPTAQAEAYAAARSPKNAVILAAGFGMRMVPINLVTPKALLEVNGERLIDRLIRQLHEAGVTDITVVVGFMKDRFEYLIDEFGARLVYNAEYASRNNLHSLRLAEKRLGGTYIVPCDLFCRENPFRARELYSWYMVSERMDMESSVRVNRRGELVNVRGGEPGNAMVGICYLTDEDAQPLRARLRTLDDGGRHADSFWEEALYEEGADRMTVQARLTKPESGVEINTYEQLRELDSASNHLRSDAITAISGALGVEEGEITDITVLKKGMTNRSFLFSARGRKYIMRIPGEGTDQLINRAQEAEVFRAIRGLGLCDDPVYINPENGYKITAFLDGVRSCDPDDVADLKKCMAKLRAFHEMRLSVPHEFDIFGQIEFYESLWEGDPSIYRDYARTKANVLSLKAYIDAQPKEKWLTHIDAVPDNFLFYQAEGGEALQLTDWEYAGMQDPHVDIAMFSIYSLYEKPQVDRLIDIYFEGGCDRATRAKIYCYVAACGLLWSNWCEYKRRLGVEFGEYSLKQYRFAKDYYKYARALIDEK